MATFDYADLRDNTAAPLLAEFGQAAVLRRPTVGSGPARNPGVGAPTDYDCTLVVDTYRNFERDGTRIKAGDKKVLLSTEGLTVAPLTSDQLVIAGEVHSIVNVEPLSPGGVVVMWTVQARR